MKVVRLEDAEVVSFGPGAVYQPLIGDDENVPLRTGIQTSKPGYATAVHSHPYMEVLFVLEGTAEAWVEGDDARTVILRKGDTIAIPANVQHGFRVIGDEDLKTLGIHASPQRIVHYKDPGHRSDSRGYPVRKAPDR